MTTGTALVAKPGYELLFHVRKRIAALRNRAGAHHRAPAVTTEVTGNVATVPSEALHVYVVQLLLEALPQPAQSRMADEDNRPALVAEAVGHAVGGLEHTIDNHSTNPCRRRPLVSNDGDAQDVSPG